ncbi:MAG: sigma-70 family RNA polymerase sigma factor [Candidatus Poribacteria bacterium]|nr:sigma-70 family RNA polymerase sigma factor [Candidatus Poribacteria bacterium]
MDKNDVQLIHNILSGDDEAFSTLVQRYQKSVHALAWRKIGDFHYAEEIMQDTFLQAYEKLPTLKNRNQFAGWLYVITNNLCTDWLRKKKPAMQSLGDASVKAIDKLTYERYILEQRETEATQHRHEIVKQLLEKLPESERTVVTLYYLGEMTTKEIGKFLGVSVNTITSRLQRARERLQTSDERLINETLAGWQLSGNLLENIMRQVADIRPVSPPTGKPLLPWMALGTATVLVILLLGVSHQYLARFQRPYSFEAQSEPTIEIIEAVVVLETDAKPDMRNQIGQAAIPGKNSSVGSQVSEEVIVPTASEDFPNLFTSNVVPKVTRFTLSNGIRIVNLHVENSTDVGIFSYLPLGLVTDGKAKAQWSHLVNYLTLRTAGPIDYKTNNGETMVDNMRMDFIGNTDTWTQGLALHAKWLAGLPFSAESLAEARPNVLSQIDYIEANLVTHKLAKSAWNQVFRHGETDIAMREDIQSAQLSELEEYRDQHLVQADRVLLCVIGGVNPETLKETMEKQLGTISLTEKTLPRPTAPQKIAKDQNATWDVNVTHYMEAYPIPRPENGDYPALYIASLLWRLACTQDAQLKELTGYIHCGVDLVTPEQVYLYGSASLKPNADIERVKQRIRELMNPLKQAQNNAQVPMIAQSLSTELSIPPDMKTLMQHKPENLPENLMLLQLGVSWGTIEYQYGNTLPQLASAFTDVAAADVASVVNRYLTEDHRMTLLLTPQPGVNPQTQ